MTYRKPTIRRILGWEIIDTLITRPPGFKSYDRSFDFSIDSYGIMVGIRTRRRLRTLEARNTRRINKRYAKERKTANDAYGFYNGYHS